MLRKSLFLMLFTLLIVPAFAQDELRQWASSAEASSEFSNDDWSAKQATGEPDTTVCKDSPTAWASKDDDTREELTVFFNTPVVPSEVSIHQNFGRGSITGIELIPASGDDNITLRRTADTDDDECPGVFVVSIDDVEDLVSGVVISVDQRDAGKWNEIDAVELVGIPGDDDSSSGNDDNNSSDSGNSDVAYGRAVSCDEGGDFTNGTEFTVIQMRVRSTYTVTAIGLNGFDPILAVLADGQQGLCDDNSAEAAAYQVDLPTTGAVDGSRDSAQVVFTNKSVSGESFRDITFVVGGKDNQAGEFVLLLEGLTLSYEDGIGDIMSVHTNQSMIDSEIPLTMYMISVTDVFDPWLGLVDGELNFLQDSDDNYFECDNAGTSSCWGDSNTLDGFAVSRSNGKLLAGGSKDAMMTFTIGAGFEDAYINYVMSTIKGTYGDYIIAFHSGVGKP